MSSEYIIITGAPCEHSLSVRGFAGLRRNITISFLQKRESELREVKSFVWIIRGRAKTQTRGWRPPAYAITNSVNNDSTPGGQDAPGLQESLGAG